MDQQGDRWLYAWSAPYAAIGAASLLVPLYAISLGAGPFLVGLIAATAALAGVPGALLWGRLAERTGRHRRFVLISLGLTGMALLAMPLVPTVDLVIVANAFLWFAVSAAAPVLTLLVVADHEPGHWDARIGLLNTYQGYAWLAGLLAGAAWNALGPRVVPGLDATRLFFFVLAAVTILGYVASYRLLPGTTITIREFTRSRAALDRLARGAGRRIGLNPISPLRIFWGIRRLHPRRFRHGLPGSLARYFAALALAFTGFAVFFGPLPAYLAAEASLDTGDIFAVFLASSAGAAISYTAAGRLATDRGPYIPQFGALGVRAILFPIIAAVAALAVHALPVMLLLFFLIGATWAVIAVTATSIVTRLAPPTIRGDALGLYTAIGGTATAAGSLLGGWIATRIDYLGTFGLAGGLVLVGLVIAYGEYRRSTAAD